MEFEHTKCQGCGTNKPPLFWIQPMKDANDFWCEKCQLTELEKRAEETKIKQSKGWRGQKNT